MYTKFINSFLFMYRYVLMTQSRWFFSCIVVHNYYFRILLFFFWTSKTAWWNFVACESMHSENALHSLRANNFVRWVTTFYDTKMMWINQRVVLLSVENRLINKINLKSTVIVSRSLIIFTSIFNISATMELESFKLLIVKQL